MSVPSPPKPLAGYTIGVTADRRSDEQISLLAGRGAECMHGPTVRTHPLRPEAEIAAATKRLVAEPPDFVLLTTGIGVRGWLEAADALLIGEELRLVLAASRLLVRGPKAHGAAITAGLDVEWNAPTATTDEVIGKLVELAEPGARVGVQIDGDPHRSLVPELEAKGYDVIAVPVYRWSLPDDLTKAQSLVRAVVDRRVDLVTFTARPAAENFTRVAVDLGLLGEVRAAFADDVEVVCIGHVCAEGAVDLCDEPIIPERFRLGAMVMTITSTLAARNHTVMIGGHEVALQGRMAWVEGSEPVMLTGRERQILQVLLQRGGAVMSKEQLLRSVWSGSESDEHVVEVTVGRLRRRLGPAGPGIETVIRRGYRVSPT
ncbi:MAG: uroporphyrinogen-III synthase [Actinomycetota bacterium]